MEDVSSRENLCIKISGCPIAWKKPGRFLFPQLSEVLRSYLVTASLLFSSPRAKAPPPTAGKAKDTAESTKLTPAWVRHPSTTSLAGLLRTQPSILGALPRVTPCLHPSSPLKEWIGDSSPAPPAPWLVARCHGGVDLFRCSRGGSGFPAPWERGAVPPRAAVWLQSDVWDWVNHRENRTTSWKKSTLCPPTPTPPSKSESYE